MATPTDAPPPYLTVAQRYRPRTPSPLTFSVSATPLSTRGETVAADLPPPYSKAIEQNEDNEQ